MISWPVREVGKVVPRSSLPAESFTSGGKVLPWALFLLLPDRHDHLLRSSLQALSPFEISPLFHLSAEGKVWNCQCSWCSCLGCCGSAGSGAQCLPSPVQTRAAPCSSQPKTLEVFGTGTSPVPMGRCLYPPLSNLQLLQS